MTVDESSVLKDRDGPGKSREAPMRALRGADGVLTPDGLFVPALGIALGSFCGSLPHKTPERVKVAP